MSHEYRVYAVYRPWPNPLVPKRAKRVAGRIDTSAFDIHDPHAAKVFGRFAYVSMHGYSDGPYDQRKMPKQTAIILPQVYRP